MPSEFKNQINTAMESITNDIGKVNEIMDEFDYRLKVICLTLEAHIEHLYVQLIKFDIFFFY